MISFFLIFLIGKSSQISAFSSAVSGVRGEGLVPRFAKSKRGSRGTNRRLGGRGVRHRGPPTMLCRCLRGVERIRALSNRRHIAERPRRLPMRIPGIIANTTVIRAVFEQSLSWGVRIAREVGVRSGVVLMIWMGGVEGYHR